MASSAYAIEFKADRLPKPISEEEPGKTKGGSAGAEFSQEFTFGVFKIRCNVAKAYAKTVGEGAITWATSKTFATEIKFSKCLTVAKFGSFTGGLATRFNEGLPMKIVYHINGYAETGVGETETEVELGGAEASFKISGKICKINWPAQTIPAVAEKKPEGEYSSAVYSKIEPEVPESEWKKFPSHKQKKLIIANAFKGMSYEYEEGQCMGEGGFEEEVEKSEGKSAKYLGTLQEEVIGGNLYVE